jgi:amino acid adenylation domain-containing protein
MPHRALANLLDWQLRSFTVPHPARTLQFSSPSFDVSFQEIFSTWCSGGSLILIADDLRRDPAALLRFLNDNAIERLFLPFVALQQIAEVLQEQGTPPRHLCEIITAGEQLRVTQAIASWLGDSPECTLHNHYGPSESHVVTTFTLHGPPGEWPALPPIGRPIANTGIYLLDARMQPVPIGVPGELYISGANLARGYLDRPNLTAEKFVPNPFAIAKNKEQRTENKDQTICNLQSAICNRLYKTGDLARYLPDGNIEFLGRADTQVKLRGYRIELGEVEAALEQHPRVREAVVVAREDTPGEKRLVAYFVPSQAQRTENKEQGDERPETSRQADRQADQSAEVSILNSQFSISELRAFLQERLPGYMVPAVFAALETWPLTPSGKVDRRALPAPEQSAVERQDSYVAPRDTLELELARMWEELLGVQSIGIRDSFFDLGGHSLLVVRLISRMQKQFGQSPPLSALFQEATVEHLARTLRGRAGPLSRSPLVGLRPAGTKKPFFCVHPGAGNVLCYLELAHRLGADQPFYGLQAAGIEGEQPPRTQVEEMAAAYLDALRAVQPEGPYLLGGWSFGGLVAFEMARQLHIQGQEIGLLALIDSYAPPPDPEPAGDDVGLLAWFAYDLARRFGKEPPVSADDLRRVSPERRLPYLLELAQAADILPADIDERQIRGAIEVFTANMRAMRSYWPPTYAGRVTLLRAGEIAPGEPPEPTLGWGAVALGGVEVFDIAGDHYTIVSPPHVQALAERLGACIDAVQIGHTNSV